VSRPDGAVFVRPAPGWFCALDGGIVVLAVLAADGPGVRSVRHGLGRARIPLPPRTALRTLLAATAVIHLAEAAVAMRVARRHGWPAGRWAAQTLAVGFPSLLALRRAGRGAPVSRGGCRRACGPCGGRT
jgi:hypothetical protein